ncbi:SDR family oxidoreductase [Leptolyngbya sp. FACHB-261]|uniref:SDR family oxidoreductase n=1 Tax=Leptolyngbya sp. FACHB-261 TaxID=2692806 RepID=UPI001685AD9D|nr:SDR family oxidoreductase [Leptolyngbya sp. FACHB-261]MBD2102414.1 SDR family oxidoreductase [Leptolyngbya sp. FACHB-261]
MADQLNRAIVKGTSQGIEAGAVEYAQQGIRINSVSAGFINTPLNTPEIPDFSKSLALMGRLGKVKEIVDAVFYLIETQFTTGEILHVDGTTFAGK